MHDIAAILVNFNSGALCGEAVRSLRAQRFPGRDGSAGRLGIVVVDNASIEDQRPFLEPLRALDVQVIYSSRNTGYGGGMNLGLERAQEAEYALLANPDILVPRGSLAALLELLRTDHSIGLAGPRSYLDGGRFLLQPATMLPTLKGQLREALAGWHSSQVRRLATIRTHHSSAFWLAEQPLEVDMLAGSCLFMPFALARRMGPFDPRFPFYFEDADLCRRVRQAGYRLVYEPRADLVHFFNRSARFVPAAVQRKFVRSQKWYFQKHYGLAANILHRAALRLGGRPGRASHLERDGFEQLGVLEQPPTLTFPATGSRFILELSISPDFLFCGGHVGTGSSVTFNPMGWNALEAVRWYLRILDGDDLRVVRAATFEKRTPPRPPPSFEQFESEVRDG